MLQEYLLVSQHKPRVEHYVRQGDDTWLFKSAEGMDAAITVLGVPLTLSEVYDKITFPVAEPLRGQADAG